MAITGTGITDIDNQSFYNLMQTPKDSPNKDMLKDFKLNSPQNQGLGKN